MRYLLALFVVVLAASPGYAQQRSTLAACVSALAHQWLSEPDSIQPNQVQDFTPTGDAKVRFSVDSAFSRAMVQCEFDASEPPMSLKLLCVDAVCAPAAKEEGFSAVLSLDELNYLLDQDGF